MSLRLRVAGSVVASALLVGAAVGIAHAASEEAAKRELESIRRARELDEARRKDLERESAALRHELEKLRAEMIATARRVQQHEEAATKLENEIKALNRQERSAKQDLLRRRGQMIGTLSALERLANRPPEAMLAMPASPVDTVRSALLLRAAIPPLERKAGELRERLDELARLRRETAVKRDGLGKALAELRRERAQLARLADRKGLLRDRADAESRDVAARLEGMAREAKDLRELLARVEAERKAEEARRRAREETRRRAAEEARRQAAEQRAAARRQDDAARDADREATAALNAEMARRLEAGLPPQAATEPDRDAAPAPPRPAAVRVFSAGRSAIILPARGRIVHTFGEGQGGRDRGLTVETRPGAQVVAPHDGQIVYAGPFRGYGLVLIIDHGDGYHSLLTGLSRLDGRSGQWVLAGEPIGAMGQPEDGRPSLYVELRHKGQPINPLPMLAAQRG